MNDRWLKLCSIAVFSGFLAACSTTPETGSGSDSAPVEDSGSSRGSDGSSAATTSAIGSSGSRAMHPLDDENSLLFRKTIYFDYDSSQILNEDRAVVEAHAQYLADNPDASVTLEGHADERGTREYNRALGEQRANSIRQLVGLLGASGQQTRTLSYGEERPAEEGHDEFAWSKNRRVEIIYRTR